MIHMVKQSLCKQEVNHKRRHGQSFLLFATFLAFMFLTRMMHIILCLDFDLYKDFNSAELLYLFFYFFIVGI
jgi:hypothetical protein